MDIREQRKALKATAAYDLVPRSFYRVVEGAEASSFDAEETFRALGISPHPVEIAVLHTMLRSVAADVRQKWGGSPASRQFAHHHAVATVIGHGAVKYGVNNWRTQPDAPALYWAAAKRHCFQILLGEELDTDSGHPHTWHLLTNLVFLQELWYA